MVSANLNRIADEFDDMIEERDWQGFVALAGLGAVGGVLAEMFQDRVAPRLNQPLEPNTPQGLGVSFLIKATAALVLGFGALKTSGTAALALGVLGIGAAVDAGVDFVEAGDRIRTTGVSAPQQAKPPQQPSVPTQPSQPESPPSIGEGSSGGLMAEYQ